MKSVNFKTMIIMSVVFAGVMLIPRLSPAADVLSSAAQGQTASDQTVVAELDETPKAPDLADIVPLAGKLAGRLATLEKDMENLVDVSSIDEQCVQAEESLKSPFARFKEMKESGDIRFAKLVALRDEIGAQRQLFENKNKPLSQSIRQLSAWKQEWTQEKAQWNEWQASINVDSEVDQLAETFAAANNSIDTALSRIATKLEAMLNIQEKAGGIYAEINGITVELDSLIMNERRNALVNAAPHIFSRDYIMQFKSEELWRATRNAIIDIQLPSASFFDRAAWAILIQLIVAFFTMAVAFKKRSVLKASKQWRFLGMHPVATGLFIGYMATILIYGYMSAPETWIVGNSIVGGMAFAIICGHLMQERWKAHCVYALISMLLVSRTIDVVSFPLPLVRLYTLGAAVLSVLLCRFWIVQSARNKEKPGFFLICIRLGLAYFTLVAMTEIFGKRELGFYLLICMLQTLAIVFSFTVLLRILHGWLEWIFRSISFKSITLFQIHESELVVGRLARFMTISVWASVLLPVILKIWGLYENFPAATKGVLEFGFDIGAQHISVGLLLLTISVLYAAFFASWLIQKLIMDQVIMRNSVEWGVRYAMARLAYYVIMVIGFVLAIITIGFEVTKLTIMLSALGVGIGFGLQGVVNNFVSGLILLFERPVRVGDTIEVTGKWAVIKRIGLRSTIVRTLDESDVIIPNADLVSNQVTNWTLSNRKVRLKILVGVAYGSDVSLVMKTLRECADSNEKLAKDPAPLVLFKEFGESSLDFQLWAWVLEANDRLQVMSDLHQDIDRSFREAHIEIAFPQRDLHLRSVDNSISFGQQKNNQ